MTIPCPEGYNKDEFACACSNPVCIMPKEQNRVWSKEMMITYGSSSNLVVISFFISTAFFFLNPIKSCRYVCFLVTLKTPHH